MLICSAQGDIFAEVEDQAGKGRTSSAGDARLGIGIGGAADEKTQSATGIDIAARRPAASVPVVPKLDRLDRQRPSVIARVEADSWLDCHDVRAGIVEITQVERAAQLRMQGRLATTAYTPVLAKIGIRRRRRLYVAAR